MHLPTPRRMRFPFHWGDCTSSGTPMDFTQMKPIGRDIEDSFEDLRFGNGFDHNWVLDHAPGVLSLAARARDPKSGRTMETYTDLPGFSSTQPTA